MKDRKMTFAKFDGEVSVEEDDARSTHVIINGRDKYNEEIKFHFEWNLAEKIEREEFEKFLTVVLSSIEIAIIPKGDGANGDYELAVGNTNTSFYFWATSKEPYRKSHFLTHEEVSKLLSEDYQKMFFTKLEGKASIKTDDSGATIIVPLRNEFFENRSCFEWNLAEQIEREEFEKFLTVALPRKDIALVAVGDLANGNYDLTVGNLKTECFFWTYSKNPYMESCFLTPKEVEELLREL